MAINPLIIYPLKFFFFSGKTSKVRVLFTLKHNIGVKILVERN